MREVDGVTERQHGAQLCLRGHEAVAWAKVEDIGRCGEEDLAWAVSDAKGRLVVTEGLTAGLVVGVQVGGDAGWRGTAYG